MFHEFDIKKISVPTDFSKAADFAIVHAVDIAKRFNAELLLIHVLEKGAYQGIFSPSKLTEYVELENAKQKLMDDAATLKKDTGLKVSHQVVTGRIYEEIVRVSEEAEVDLIVMGTHGVSGWAEFFVGSNAFKVVTQSPCPVLSIQENATAKELKNIILPIDGSAESRQKVRHAAAMSKKFGSTVHIASLLMDDEPAIRHEFEIKVKQVTDFFTKEEIPFTTAVLVGSNLATMTMNFAESKGGNLIVMMTEQEPNVTGFLMGPFAQQVVNHARIPVMSVSPEEGEGFHLT